MIVIDASSIAKYILKEKNWESVRKYLYERQTFSLTLALAEVSNAIWKHCVLYKKISIKEAKTMFSILEILENDVIIFEPLKDYLKDALNLSIEERITVYDSLYIVQAEKYGEFLTSDEKQWSIAEKRGIKAKYIE